MKKIAVWVAFVLLFAGVPVYALDAPFDEGLAKLADQKSYTMKVPGMFLYGLYEIGESPLEPLTQPWEQTVEKKDYAFGGLRGVNRGIYNAFEGFTRGTFNIVRSFVPGMGRYEAKETQSKMLPDGSA